MRVLVAMSGGVDSSVAAALVAERLGPDQVVGATLKLWGGSSDSGCCSVADVEDARRVAEQLGLVHHVFNFAAEFEERVVDPYVQGHAEGRTPNPVHRVQPAPQVRPVARAGPLPGLRRGGHRPPCPLPGDRRRTLPAVPRCRPAEGPVLCAGHARPGPAGPHPVPGGGDDQGRGARGGARGSACAPRPSRTARTSASSARTRAGRGSSGPAFRCTPGRLVDHDSGEDLGPVEAVELVTVGQRRGMGHGPDGTPALRDRGRRAGPADLPRLGRGRPALPESSSTRSPGSTAIRSPPMGTRKWKRRGPGGVPVIAQCSAHGRPVAGTVRRTSWAAGSGGPGCR